jgi:hypothetical protein
MGYVAAFLTGVGVLYGAVLAGTPWPPVRGFSLVERPYERTSVQVEPLSGGDDDLRRRLADGWEVESTSQQSRSSITITTYVLRRRQP